MKSPYFNYNLTNGHKKAMKLSRIPSQNKQILLLEYYPDSAKIVTFLLIYNFALHLIIYAIYNKVYNSIQITFKRYSNAV